MSGQQIDTSSDLSQDVLRWFKSVLQVNLWKCNVCNFFENVGLYVAGKY